MERLIAVSNETTASTSRISRDGRKITYKLKVLQQPERARACGSGAKSSADRRPVDPPPIVELRIFEGENEEKDITFQLSANYFLFATLEQARPIAQGRVPTDSSRATVLTGTPVAGMVYLDRPEPAGYFIFPDLSVRHEGKYRLGFSLYEELKEIKDIDRADGTTVNGQGPEEACVTHRLEVRSQPFIVYSAKKFPGLASSTSLSRTVAEQGCRVRIRRDVRMRRRDKPEKGGYDGYSDARSATPDMYQQQLPTSHGISERERSASIASHVSLVGGPDARRTSMQEMAHPYAQPAYAAGPAPPPSHHPVGPPQAQYGAPMPQQYAPPHYAYQQAPMQPPSMPYQGYPYPQNGVAPVSQAPAYHYQQQSHVAPAPQYETQGHIRNRSTDYGVVTGVDSRRASIMAVAPPPYQYGQQHAMGAHYPHQQSSGYSMAPAQSHEAIAGPHAARHGSGSGPSHTLPPLNTSLQARDKLEPATPISAMSGSHPYYGSSISQQATADVGASHAHAGSKRGYDRVFNTEHMNGPLRQVARPSSPHIHGHGHSIDHGPDEGAPMQMSYRRADGREIARPLPPSI